MYEALGICRGKRDLVAQVGKSHGVRNLAFFEGGALACLLLMSRPMNLPSKKRSPRRMLLSVAVAGATVSVIACGGQVSPAPPTAHGSVVQPADAGDDAAPMGCDCGLVVEPADTEGYDVMGTLLPPADGAPDVILGAIPEPTDAGGGVG